MIMTNHGKIFIKGGNVIQMLHVPPHELTEPLHKRGTSRREGKPLPSLTEMRQQGTKNTYCVV